MFSWEIGDECIYNDETYTVEKIINNLSAYICNGDDGLWVNLDDLKLPGHDIDPYELTDF